MSSPSQNPATSAMMQAYGRANKTIRSERESERDILMLVTRRMKEAVSKPDDKLLLARAVSDNLSVWSVLVADVMDDANPLPQELRANITSVGMAVMRECKKMSDGTVNVEALIKINEAVAEGLQ